MVLEHEPLSGWRDSHQQHTRGLRGCVILVKTCLFSHCTKLNLESCCKYVQPFNCYFSKYRSSKEYSVLGHRFNPIVSLLGHKKKKKEKKKITKTKNLHKKIYIHINIYTHTIFFNKYS